MFPREWWLAPGPDSLLVQEEENIFQQPWADSTPSPQTPMGSCLSPQQAFLPEACFWGPIFCFGTVSVFLLFYPTASALQPGPGLWSHSLFHERTITVALEPFL